MLGIFLVGAWVAPSAFATGETLEPGVEGMVLDPASGAGLAPVQEAHVYAYEVTTSRMREVVSDERGRFLFDSLPAGLYRLIAFKPGFAPAIELLLRRRVEDRQFVEMELSPARTENAPADDAYWQVRSRVPADVLRQIHQVHTEARAPEGLQIEQAALFQADLRALSGVESVGGGLGNVQRTDADFEVRGEVGNVRLGIDGLYQDLGETDGLSQIEGQVRNLALRIDPVESQSLRFSTSESQLALHDIDPVDLLRYQLDWAGRTGTRGQSRISASYMQEKNFHVGGGNIRPATIPDHSESWNLEGSYAAQLSERTAVRAGLLYSQRTTSMLDLGGLAELDESLGLFTIAENQLQPKVMIEYGIYSSVRDGSVSLMPHGGMVVKLGEHWQVRSSAAQRIEDEVAPEFEVYDTFHTAFYTDRSACRLAGEACYEVTLARTDGDEEFSIGALHREFSDTLRLYFSSDFFSRLESVFLVEGDELPELQLSLVRQISPQILAKLESNLASGGGGIFYATDDTSYQNRVRYLVTSLDTRFQATSTGVFVAFHHLEQDFDPVEENQADTSSKVEMQRLQLMLTQDLSALIDLTSKWAVRLNMELSRGATPLAITADGELYKKLTGGISVSF